MCINGEFLSMLEVMNAGWDYRGRRSMLVMKMVDGVMSMGMMSVIKVIIFCHSFLDVRYYFAFWIFLDFYSFCFNRYGHYGISLFFSICLFLASVVF